MEKDKNSLESSMYFISKFIERNKIRVSFCDRIQQILKAKNIKSSDFQALTLLSKDIFSKLKKQDYKPTFKTVITLCAGLDLDIYTTNELLQKAGYSFNGSKEHTAYVTIITKYEGESISVRNEFLKEVGIKLLGEKNQ